MRCEKQPPSLSMKIHLILILRLGSPSFCFDRIIPNRRILMRIVVATAWTGVVCVTPSDEQCWGIV